MVQHLIKPVCQGPHCWHPVPAPPDADPAAWRETCCQCARHRDRTRHLAPWLGHGPYTPTRRWVDDPPPGATAPFTMQRTPELDAAIQQRYGDDVSAEVQRLAAQVIRAGGIKQVTLIQDPTLVPDDRQAAHDPPPGATDPSARATLTRLAAVAEPASGVLAYCGRCGELAAWCTCSTDDSP